MRTQNIYEYKRNIKGLSIYFTVAVIGYILEELEYIDSYYDIMIDAAGIFCLFLGMLNIP